MSLFKLIVNKRRGATCVETPFKLLAVGWLSDKKEQVKESTHSRYHDIVHKHIIPRLGKHSSNRITTELLQNFVNELLDNGRLDGCGGLADKMVSDIWAIVKEIFEYAQDERWCIISCNLNKIKVHVEKKEAPILSKRAQTILTNFLLENVNYTKLGILLCLHTGLRLGEICAAKWNDIDISKGTLKVRSTLQRIKITEPDASGKKTKIIITEPKTKSSIREVPIPNFIIPLLEELKAASNAFLLTGEEDKYISPRTMQNRFRAILKKAKIDYINFHRLRHTFASEYIESGFEAKSLSKIMGHSNSSTTTQLYVHPSLDFMRENMNKVSAKMMAC